VAPRGLVRDPSADFPGPAPFANYTPPTDSRLYKATLEIKDHRLTGLLIIKYMAPLEPGSRRDHGSYRVVFTSEVGMTFFDLELKERHTRVMSCFPSLKKRALLHLLGSNFRKLTWESAPPAGRAYRQKSTGNLVMDGRRSKTRYWYVYSPAGDTLNGLSARSSASTAVKIGFSRYDKDQPGVITLENPLIGMKMTLKNLH